MPGGFAWGKCVRHLVGYDVLTASLIAYSTSMARAESVDVGRVSYLDGQVAEGR